MDYLKKTLATNIPKIVTMAKRMQPVEEKEYGTGTPTGAMQFPYKFTLDDGREMMHYAKEYEEQKLSLFKEGEQLQVVRTEKQSKNGRTYKLYEWTTTDGAEAKVAANPQPESNTSHTRSMDAHKAKEIQICLQGLMQAHISAGKDNKEAMELAVEAREMLLAEVKHTLSHS